MTFLLDTNVVSELRRPERADRNVEAWITGQYPESLHLSCVSLLEIELGALRTARKDRPQGEVLRRWIDDRVVPNFGARILPIDAAIALRCAALHVPDPRPDRDAWIAATALVHDLTVVTRNIKDFAPTGVRMFNPWLPTP